MSAENEVARVEGEGNQNVSLKSLNEFYFNKN